jgi:hypothetical protein
VEEGEVEGSEVEEEDEVEGEERAIPATTTYTATTNIPSRPKIGCRVWRCPAQLPSRALGQLQEG